VDTLPDVPERFSIAHVTPYEWETAGEVNGFVAYAARELAGRGHRVLVVAPSGDPELVRASRELIARAEDEPDAVWGEPGVTRVLGVGEVMVPPARRAGTLSLPIDVARTVEELLTRVPLDFVHVHEPFAPSAASAALRHSRSLNVGSFHLPSERVLSTQLGRRVVDRFFGRLDARTASYAATGELMNRFFPARYRVLRPAAGAAAPPEHEHDAGARVEIAYPWSEERPALRVLLRALRRLPLDLAWRATVLLPEGREATPVLRRDLRERVRFLSAPATSEEDALAGADVVVAASAGTRPAPGALVRAIAAGVVPVASRLPVHEELLDEGGRGLLFEPGDAVTLAGQLERLIREPELRSSLRERAEGLRSTSTWSRVADDLEEIYGEVAARRHADAVDPGLRARLAARPLIDVDLHMHTDHSHDCATPVEVLLQTAREQGLGAIAVTDHNEISGALEAEAKAEGVKVIVGEEVKTASQGEVIGLFIREKIARGMSLTETIAEIRRQGGVVYVPHPFDRLHAVPDYEHLLDVLEDVDAIEVFNPRVAISAFNEEAARFAAKYRLVAGAGSDSHVAQGLGSVRIRMRDFDGPEEFMESLRDADIIRKPTSLLYVQALKFLQTRATPAPARRAARAARVRRANRAAEGGEARNS
jgi:glycosyltransferase involved in cell wall biosynthesis